MSEKEPAAVQELRNNVVSAAAEAIVAAMTPQQMRACSEGILEKVLASISGSEYGNLGRLVKDMAEEEMKKYLKTENAQSMVKSAVIKGVHDACDGLSEEIKGKVTQAALTTVFKALTFEPRSRY